METGLLSTPALKLECVGKNDYFKKNCGLKDINAEEKNQQFIWYHTLEKIPGRKVKSVILLTELIHKSSLKLFTYYIGT